MYNRYMQTDFPHDEVAHVDYIPVTRKNENEEEYAPPAAEVTYSDDYVEPCSAAANDCNEVCEKNSENENFLSNLFKFDISKIDIESVFVILLAFFVLCDKTEDITNCIVLLVVLFLLGF